MPQRIANPEELQPSAQQTADGQGAKTIDTRAAEHVEVWVLVTAIVAGTILEIPILTSPDDGTTFKEIARITGITATGAFPLALSRSNGDPLGERLRADFDLSGSASDVTFSMRSLTKE